MGRALAHRLRRPVPPGGPRPPGRVAATRCFLHTFRRIDTFGSPVRPWWRRVARGGLHEAPIEGRDDRRMPLRVNVAVGVDRQADRRVAELTLDKADVRAALQPIRSGYWTTA